ncbi:hypothetical protein EB796_014769 [Bugula neritina]|uniref:Uncharacterized protein n=1 Tax=Bugula neritina TaxID=10212 RepID=A0A7J7JLL3_BUGNE|nr:hypothetical protein EB796_014769 [Bugula neritina]
MKWERGCLILIAFSIFLLSVYYMVRQPCPAVSGVDLVSPQEFWETMVNAASEAAVLPNMNIPDNLTEVVEMLKEFSLALEENGAIYNMVDDLGTSRLWCTDILIAWSWTSLNLTSLNMIW